MINQKSFTVKEALEVLQKYGITDSEWMVRTFIRKGEIVASGTTNRQAGYTIKESDLMDFVHTKRPELKYQQEMEIMAKRVSELESLVEQQREEIERLKSGEPLVTEFTASPVDTVQTAVASDRKMYFLVRMKNGKEIKIIYDGGEYLPVTVEEFMETLTRNGHLYIMPHLLGKKSKLLEIKLSEVSSVRLVDAEGNTIRSRHK